MHSFAFTDLPADQSPGPVRQSTALKRAHFNPFAVTIYILLHLGCFGILYTGVSAEAMAVLCVAFLIRALGVSIVYHRYFAHRSFRTSRLMQFCLGLYGSLTVLGGLLWWAQTHREHHRHADTPDDIHSPAFHGFIYSHCGWFLDDRHRSLDLSKVRDLARFPELIWLERLDVLSKLSYIACCYWLFGIVGVVWGFFVPAVIVLQMVHWIQSVSHSIGGYRRYASLDDSRNHWLFGIISFGEGFHHNHHCFPNSARLGLHWWEFDASYFVLLALEWSGLIWDLKVPTRKAPPGRDKMERDVIYVRAKIRKMASKLDAAIASLESGDREESHAAYRDLRERLTQRTNALSAQMRELLVRGPFVLQQAVEELQDALRNDASRSIALPTGRPQMTAVLERIDAAISGLPPGIRRAHLGRMEANGTKLLRKR
jgi:stearoyl-CoA desaturase (delta-9 desaturase)